MSELSSTLSSELGNTFLQRSLVEFGRSGLYVGRGHVPVDCGRVVLQVDGTTGCARLPRSTGPVVVLLDKLAGGALALPGTGQVGLGGEH